MTSTKKTKATTGHVTVHTHTSAAAVTEKPSPQSPPAPPAAAAPPAGSLAARIAAILAVLEELPVLLGSAASPAEVLTIGQRQSLAKLKPGAEEKIPAMLALADKYEISIAGTGTAEARADLQLASDLQPLETELASAAALVKDTITQAKQRTWDTTRAAYGTLKQRRYQQKFPALQKELAPMASFMAIKHKDAPTVLRQAEAKTLSRTRATRSANKEKAATAPAVKPSPVTPPPPAPPVASTIPAGDVPAPKNGAANAGGAGAPVTSSNGAAQG